MAFVTKKDGSITQEKESNSEFTARIRKQKEKEKALRNAKNKAKQINKTSGKNVANVITNREGTPEVVVIEDPKIVAVKKNKSGKVIKELTNFDVLKIKNEALKVKQPKGSVKVTKGDGSQVYRTSGKNAKGTYVKDVAVRITENKQPKGSVKVTKGDGSQVYRISGKNAKGTYVKDTPFYELKGENKFIQSKESLESEEKKKRIDGLVSPFPNKSNNKVLQSFKEGFTFQPNAERIVKGGTGFEALSYTAGAVTGIAINTVGGGIGKAGGFLATKSSKVLSLFKNTGKALNIPTIKYTLGGLYAYTTGKETIREIKTDGSRGAVRSSVNVIKDFAGITGVIKGAKTNYEKALSKFTKTDVKGTVTGFQDTTVSKAKGIFKDEPFSEISVKVKDQTNSIIDLGNKRIITSQNKDLGTFKILEAKSRIKVDRIGAIPTKFSKVKTGEFKLKQTGTFKPEALDKLTQTKPNTFQKDILEVQNKAKFETKIGYKEQTISKGSLNKKIDPNINYNLNLNQKAKSELKGVVTDQIKQSKNVEIVWENAEATTISVLNNKGKNQIFGLKENIKSLEVENIKPQIEFSNKPNPKDSYSFELTNTGYKTSQLTEPKQFIAGEQFNFIKGDFSLTSNNLKPPKISESKFSKEDLIKLDKAIYGDIAKPQPKKIKISENKPSESIKSEENIFRPKRSFNNVKQTKTELIYAEETISKPIYNIPTQTELKPISIQPTQTRILSQIKTSNIVKPLVFETQDNKQIYSVREISSSKSKVNNIYDSKATSTAFIGSKTNIESRVKSGSKFKDLNKGKSKSNIKTEPKSAIKSITEQIQEQTQINQNLQILNNRNLRSINFNDPFKITPSSIKNLKIDLSKNSQINKEKGFDVFVRKKGTFKKINTKALSKNQAINFGAVRVGNTASASFKIEESNSFVSDSFKGKGKLKDFYKNEDDIFIEKRGRRIKSIGELQEITFKGIAKNKGKSIFGGL